MFPNEDRNLENTLIQYNEAQDFYMRHQEQYSQLGTSSPPQFHIIEYKS